MPRVACFAALLLTFQAYAQMHVYRPPSRPIDTRPYHRPASQVPKECEDTRGNPWLAAVCSWVNRGRPQASGAWLDIPAYGSPEAKRTGYACMGGLAMRRLANGWEQLRDRSNNFYRCRPLAVRP